MSGAFVLQGGAELATDELFLRFVFDAERVLENRSLPVIQALRVAKKVFGSASFDLEQRIAELEKLVDSAEAELNSHGYLVNWDQGYAIVDTEV